jgi:hypothetical protein
LIADDPFRRQVTWTGAGLDKKNLLNLLFLNDYFDILVTNR